MSVELKVPSVGESITEVVIGAWHKAVGDRVARDEDLVELETEKATVDVPSPAAGVLAKILKQAGETAAVGEVLGYLDEGSDSGSAQPQSGGRAKQVAPRSDDRPGKSSQAPRAETSAGIAIPVPIARTAAIEPAPTPSLGTSTEREEKIVPMSPIRRRIAQRLVQAQQTAALLTTFGEIDLSAVILLRQKYKERFQEKYGVKLGFMSFFVKAVVDALTEVPQVNSEVRGNDLIYRNYFDIGVAVGSEKGLFVPVLRNAERMSFAEIERAIADFGRRAAQGQLKVEELQGGTFTISNGGVYGSLLSTPIVNPPQSGILGMHAIQDRPVVREGAIVIRPMMYVALTYDHRVIDGKEAVTFLNRVREIIEDPSRLLIET